MKLSFLQQRKLRKEIEAILHLNGCQQYDNGWNEAKKGGEPNDKKIERLEKLTLKEVMKAIKEVS